MVQRGFDSGVMNKRQINEIVTIYKNELMRFSIIIFIGLFILPLYSRILIFNEAVNIALNKSYTIKSFEQDKEAMEFSYHFYKAMFKPRLDLGISVPSWEEKVESIQRPDGLPVYNSIGSVMFGGDLSFTYMLPTGGSLSLSSTLYQDDLSTTLALQDYETLKTMKAYTRLGFFFNQPILTTNTLRENLREAKFYYDRSVSQFTRGQMDIVYHVTGGFYLLYKATREVEIAHEKLKNAQEAYRIAQILVNNGRLPEVDLMITKVDLARNEASLSEKINGLEREKDRFKHLIGLNLEEEIEIVTNLTYDTFRVELNRAIAEALRYRLELNEVELDIQLQKIEVDRAKRYSELMGNISAYYDFTGVSTIESRTARDLFESSFGNFLERNPNRGVTITLSYPIFDWGRGRARIQEEEVRLKRRKFDLENQRNEIIREVRDVVRSVQEAKKRLKIHEDNQEISELTYNISKKRFENGDISSQELAIEQERLAESQLAYLGAYITYQLAVADLKRKTLWDFQNDRCYLKEIQDEEGE